MICKQRETYIFAEYFKKHTIVIMSHKFNILICDDHVILLEGLKVCLQRMPEVGLVAVSSTMHEAMQMLDTGQHFDLCIVDLDLPDGSGIDLIAKVKATDPEVRTMVYTSHEEIWHINAIMQSDTNGVVFKSCDVDELCFAVSRVARGDNYFCKPFQQLVRHIEMHIPESCSHLTQQEHNVLCQLARGLKAHDIAVNLNVSVNTINTHKAHLLSKFNASNTTELIIKAFVKGIVKFNLGQ